MSLLASASPWQNDNTPKKRVPTMGDSFRKTVKLRPSNGEDHEQYATQENPLALGNTIIPTIENTQSRNEEANVKINTLLNKITGFSELGGGKLADFNPPPPPEQVRKSESIAGDSPKNPLMPQHQNQIAPSSSSYYLPVEPKTYSNYAQVYPDKITDIKSANAPYYAKMGINGSPMKDDKLAERLNYMVHLLEEMQMEKTNHVTEEFLLYSLLGVFMIYLVDGFAQTGKYVR